MKIPIYLMTIIFSFVFNHSISHAQHRKGHFYFKIESANNSYNSNTKEFKRLFSSGKKTFSIQLSEKELEAIEREFKNANFSTLPTRYEPRTDTITITEPSFTYILESDYPGKTKLISYYDGKTDPQMIKEAKPFLKLYRSIWEILLANTDVKKIKASDVFWE